MSEGTYSRLRPQPQPPHAALEGSTGRLTLEATSGDHGRAFGAHGLKDALGHSRAEPGGGFAHRGWKGDPGENHRPRFIAEGVIQPESHRVRYEVCLQEDGELQQRTAPAPRSQATETSVEGKDVSCPFVGRNDPQGSPQETPTARGPPVDHSRGCRNVLPGGQAEMRSGHIIGNPGWFCR